MSIQRSKYSCHIKICKDRSKYLCVCTWIFIGHYVIFIALQWANVIALMEQWVIFFPVALWRQCSDFSSSYELHYLYQCTRSIRCPRHYRILPLFEHIVILRAGITAPLLEYSLCLCQRADTAPVNVAVAKQRLLGTSLLTRSWVFMKASESEILSLDIVKTVSGSFFFCVRSI